MCEAVVGERCGWWEVADWMMGLIPKRYAVVDWRVGVSSVYGCASCEAAVRPLG